MLPLLLLLLLLLMMNLLLLLLLLGDLLLLLLLGNLLLLLLGDLLLLLLRLLYGLELELRENIPHRGAVLGCRAVEVLGAVNEVHDLVQTFTVVGVEEAGVDLAAHVTQEGTPGPLFPSGLVPHHGSYLPLHLAGLCFLRLQLLHDSENICGHGI